MAKTFAAFQTGVARRIQDAAQKLAQPAVDDCITKAITGRYAQARPLTRIKDFAGDGVVYEYTLDSTTFPSWVDGASSIRRIQYPAGVAGEKEPTYLDGDDWGIIPISSTVNKLRLFTTVPQTGKTLRVEYTGPHTAPATGNTSVPDVDFEGVCDLAASYCCIELAAAYSQMGDTAFEAVAVDHQSKSQHYLALAKKYEGGFEAAFGLDEETKQPPATAWREWPEPSSEGSEKMTH